MSNQDELIEGACVATRGPKHDILIVNDASYCYDQECNPFGKINHNVALWCVYGYSAFPSMIGCTLRVHNHRGVESLNIWGFSIYKRQRGYRTLGISVEKFYETYGKDFRPKFFRIQADALAFIAALTNPQRTARGFKNPSWVK